MAFTNLKNLFFETTASYCSDKGIIEKCWNEIESSYSEKHRHYHTLMHLEKLVTQLEAIKTNIINQESVLFALFYHDIVYKPSQNDNEEKSAELAKMRLTELSVSNDVIDSCVQLILATKNHNDSGNADANYFTDADLSILGCDWEDYQEYAKQIRKEFSIYPDFLYNPGRKKVLNHFLEMQRIFKTQHFFELYESKARLNLKKEIDLVLS